MVYIQFNSKLFNKKEKIKSKKISDVLLSNDTTEAQGFLHENRDDCALVVYRDEEDEMEGTGIPCLLLEMQWEQRNNLSCVEVQE